MILTFTHLFFFVQSFIIWIEFVLFFPHTNVFISITFLARYSWNIDKVGIKHQSNNQSILVKAKLQIIVVIETLTFRCVAKLEVIFWLPDITEKQCLHFALKFVFLSLIFVGMSKWSNVFNILIPNNKIY